MLISLALLTLVTIEGCRTAVLIRDIKQGQASLQRGQDVLETKRLDATHEELQLARSAFESAQGDFAGARAAMRRDPLLWAAGRSPFAGSQVDAAKDLARIGEEASAIGVAGVDAATAFADVRAHGGSTLPEKSVVILERTRPSFQTIEQRLAVVDALRSEVAGKALLPPLADAVEVFDERRKRVGDVLQTYNDAEAFVPQFLGFEGPKSYLVLAQNNAELLPTGGLISVVGLMRLDQGRVTDRDFRDTGEFSTEWRRRTDGYEAAPAPLDRYLLKGASWNLAVSNWSPDFPTAAQEAQRFYALGGGGAVDGVIGINVRTLERLLAITGPVTVPEFGVVATASNVFELTEEYTRDPSAPQTDRKEFVALLARDVLDRALQPAPGQWSSLVDLLQELGDEKDLLIYSPDPALQQIVRRLGWSGEVRYDGGDFIMLVDASVNGTKLNAVMEQSIEIDVRLDAAGAAQTAISVDYFNNLTTWEAGRDPSLTERLMLGGLYGGYVRLYVPPSSTINDVRTDDLSAGLDEFGSELGLTVFGRFIALARDERQRLSFRYGTPQVLVADEGGYDYRLTVRRQPGQRPVPVSFSLTPPAGMRATSVSINGSSEEAVPPRLEFVLTKDHVIEYRLERTDVP